MQQQLQINWTMVQELRMDGELNNYSKYLVCVCVCVCVCSVFPAGLAAYHLVLFASVSTTTDARAECSFFLSSAPLACSPFHSWAAGVCGFVSGWTAAGDWISLTSATATGVRGRCSLLNIAAETREFPSSSRKSLLLNSFAWFQEGSTAVKMTYALYAETSTI